MKPWEGMLIVQRSPGNKPCTPAYRSRKTEDITAKENEQDSQVEREPRHSHIREASGAGGGGLQSMGLERVRHNLASEQ